MNVEKGEALDYYYSVKMTSLVRVRAKKSRIIIAYDLLCKISSKVEFNALAHGGFIPAMHAVIDDCRGI